MQGVEHNRFLRSRLWLAAAVIAALLAASWIALSPTEGRRALFEGLQRAAKPAPAGVAAGPARFVRRSNTGYAVAMTLTPNRANGPIAMSLRVRRHGRPLSAARVRVGFSMPSMRMWNAYTAALSAYGSGRYSATIPVLGMAGDWRLHIELIPSAGRPFAVDVDDHIAA